MNDWKAQLAEIYKGYSTQQKNKKGVTDKFDKPEHANFRGKKGFNDTGIPLTQAAAKKQQRNKSNYSYPMHLQIINERRQKNAMHRHGITDLNDPFNNNKKPSSQQPAERKNYSSSWRAPMAPAAPREKLYAYYGESSEPAPEKITYVYDVPKQEPAYKAKVIKADGKLKFKNKLEEAIYNHPNYSKQKF